MVVNRARFWIKMFAVIEIISSLIFLFYLIIIVIETRVESHPSLVAGPVILTALTVGILPLLLLRAGILTYNLKSEGQVINFWLLSIAEFFIGASLLLFALLAVYGYVLILGIIFLILLPVIYLLNKPEIKKQFN